MNRYSQLVMLGLQIWMALSILCAPAMGSSALPAQPAASPTPPVAAPPAPAAVMAEAPRAEAPFIPTSVYGDRVLTEDTAWRGNVLVEGAVTVAPQATLTVEPGTVVRFRQKGAHAPLLMVQGRLVAAGAKDAIIVFTSAFETPAPADWQGIMLVGSEKKNVLENCRIAGAKTGLATFFSNVTLANVQAERSGIGMRFQDSLVVMEGGSASGCDTGLSLSESESTFRDLTLQGNRLGLSAKRSSIYLFNGNLDHNKAAAFSADDCRVKIQRGAVLSNGSGITLLASQGSVSGVRIANSRQYGMSLTTSRIRVSGNEISGNGENGVIVFDGNSVAWDNAIYENAGYDLYNAGIEEFNAPGNWWGTTSPKVFDNNGRGKVMSAPVLESKPVAQQGQ